MNPDISIIIPVYNSQNFLDRCIDSILSQTYSNFECILVNDYSIDNSSEICNKYEKCDSRVKVIHNNRNTGSSIARKIGFDISKGEYIQFVDSDDWIENSMIENMYNTAISNKYDIVICNYYHDRNNISTMYKQFINNYDKISIIKDLLSTRLRAFLHNKIIKRDLLLLADFPLYSNSEDYYITIQNIFNSNNIGVINTPFYHYCFNDTSLSNNKNWTVQKYIHSNKNWNSIVNFLKQKYGQNLTIFEPELSTEINRLKLIYISNKQIRKNRDLFKLYPESKFYLFFFKYSIKKILKMILPYGIVLYLQKRSIVSFDKT